MGFSHDTTTHHFHLLKDGGEIVVTAKDPKDTAGVEQIRMHLSHIVGMFSNGNFTGRRSHDWELGVYAENPQNCSAQAVS